MNENKSTNYNSSDIIINQSKTLKRRISCPNMHNSKYLKLMCNLEVKKTPKKIKKYLRSLDLDNNTKQLLLEKIKEEDVRSVKGIKKKFKNSLIFTGIKLKEKIEKDLSFQKSFNELDENKDDVQTEKDKEKEKEKENINNTSKFSLDSFIKKNLNKAIKNRNLKKRKKFADKKLLKEINRKLFQIKHVYDSLEDSEEIYESSEETFCISPDSNSIYIFDLIIILCISISIVYVPLKISFHKNNCESLNTIEIIILDFIDIIYLIDLIIGFYRGYYNSDFKVVKNSKLIINKYLSTYFIYDLISALPCCSFLVFYYKDICFSYSNNNEYLFVLVLSFLKLFKIIKIKQNKFVESIYDLFSKSFLAEQIFAVLKMIIITFTILHILVCFHIFIGYHFYPSWLFSVKENYNTNNNNISLYITSFYFLISTLTTVGYGDITCLSLPERLFQLIELSLGVIIYSYIVSKIGDYVKMESYATMIYNNNSAILEEIRITHPNMPFRLYNQISHHLQTSNFQQQKKTDINLLINCLPHALKYSILFVINEKHIHNFYFFKKCYNSNFIAYTLINLVPIIYKKNSLIVKEEQLLENSFFVIEGRLSLEIAIDLENPEESIKKYLNKNYNSLKNKEIKKSSKRISTIDLLEKKNSDTSEIKTFLSRYNTIMKEKEFEFPKIERDFDESNYQFMNVSNIFKNENFGEVYIILNKQSPLFLRVKSKKTNLFLLNRKHILHLSENFPNIWKRLFKKSLKNMKALKQKTIEVVKKYRLTYNVKLIPNLMEKEKIENKNCKLNSNSSKTYNPKFYSQKYITKNFLDLKHSSTNLGNVQNEQKEIKEEKEEKEKEEISNNLVSESQEKIGLNKSVNNKIIDKKCKTVDFNKQSLNKSTDKKVRFNHHYSAKNLETNYNKILLSQLKKEIEKRDNYFRLYNESIKKIQKLYAQLVNNSIDLSKNIGKIDLDTQICNNLDLSKLILSEFNNNNNNIIRAQTMNLPKKKKSSNNILNSNNKMKKTLKKQSSRFNLKKQIKADKIFINMNQPMFILNSPNSLDSKGKAKNEGNSNNKFISFIPDLG